MRNATVHETGGPNAGVLRGLMAVWALLALVLLTGSGALGQIAGNSTDAPVLALSDGSGPHPIGANVDYYEDTQGNLTIGQVASEGFSDRFQRMREGPLSFGFSLSAYWVRFRLENRSASQREWLLEIDHPTLDRADIHISNPDGSFELRSVGDRVPASAREFRHRNLVVPLTIEPGQSRMIYIRAQSEGPVRLPMMVLTPQALAAIDRIAQIAFGFNYGVIFIMAIYNLALFFSVRDSSQLYFAGFMISFGLIQMFINGFVYEFLWPEHTFLLHVGVTVAINVAAIAVFSFTRKLLNTRETAPLLDKAMLWLTWCAAAIAVGAFLSNIVAIRLSYVIMFLTAALLFTSGVVTWRRGVRHAPFFLLAWSVFLVGLLLIALSHLGLAPDNFYTQFTIQIGSMLTAVLLSVSVADRIKSMREEKERELRESEERYALAMDGAREGLWDWDIARGIAYFSGRLKTELGLEFEESDFINPRRWLRYIHPDDRQRYMSAMREHIAGRSEAFECEYRVTAGKGETIWVLDRGVALRDENGVAYRMAGSMGNISALKETERDLRDAKEGAEQANRAKSDFLAKMSHELRTPLNAIIGFSEMMVTESLGSVGNPKYKDYARDIRDSGAHLLDLINDILDLSKVEAGKLELVERDVNLPELIQSSIHLVRERAQKGGVEIRTIFAHPAPWLRGDRRALKQVILNLLSNAVKFTPAGGTVAIKIGLDRQGGVILSVADTGIGIAEKDIAQVLRPFNQLESPLSRQHDGTGLGLSLAKSLVELHNAAMDIKSAEGAGTIVTVRFPPERTVSAPAPADREPQSAPAAKREPGRVAADKSAAEKAESAAAATGAIRADALANAAAADRQPPKTRTKAEPPESAPEKTSEQTPATAETKPRRIVRPPPRPPVRPISRPMARPAGMAKTEPEKPEPEKPQPAKPGPAASEPDAKETTETAPSPAAGRSARQPARPAGRPQAPSAAMNRPEAAARPRPVPVARTEAAQTDRPQEKEERTPGTAVPETDAAKTDERPPRETARNEEIDLTRDDIIDLGETRSRRAKG